jgi:hypothetical protein
MEGDNEQNKPDMHRRDPSTPVGEKEHETHVTALVLLSLAAIIAITIIFAVSQNTTTDLNPNTYDDSTSTPEVTEPVDEETNGAAVPIETVQTSDVSGLSGLPANLPISEDGEEIRNYSSSVGENRTQRVYMYRTTDSVTNLVSAYESWINQSDFSMTDNEMNNSNATLRSETENEQLIVSISSSDGDRQVQVNYINN